MCSFWCFSCKRNKMLEINDSQRTEMVKSLDKEFDTLEEDVVKLKKWMQEQKHLPEIMEDRRIRNFLLLNKCCIETTKKKIDMYYTIRSLVPDMYEKSNPKLPELKEIFDYLYLAPVPKLTPDLYRVSFFKLKAGDLRRFDPIFSAIQFYNLSEIRLSEDFMLGDILIYDLAGVTFNVLTKLTPTVFLKIITVYQKVYSIRIKAAIVINTPLYADTVLSALKTIVKPKIFQRIYMYRDAKILREIFPKEILPRDYGGVEKSLDELAEILKQKFHKYQDRFDVLDKLRVDEKLRSEQMTDGDILGFYANFKKLSVD